MSKNKLEIIEEYPINKIANNFHTKVVNSFYKHKKELDKIGYKVSRIGRASSGKLYYKLKCKNKTHDEFWQFSFHAGKHFCRYCKGVGLKNIDQIKAELAKKKIILLSKEYKGMQLKHDFQCMICSDKWSTVPNSIIGKHDTGCPKCSPQISKIQIRIFTELKHIFPDIKLGEYIELDGKRIEMDIYIPSEKICIEVDGEMFHSDTKKDLAKNKILTSEGIRVIRYRDKNLPKLKDSDFNKGTTRDQKFKDVSEFFIHLSKYITNKSKQNELISFKENGAFINEEDFREHRTKILIPKYEESFEALMPNLSKLWDYKKNGHLKPSDITPMSNRRVHFICSKCDKSYHYKVCDKESDTATKCGPCYSKAADETNSVQSLRPDLAKQWDYKKNGKITPDIVRLGRSSNVWWRCPDCKKSWEASPCNRRRMTEARCKFCKKITT